MGGSGRDAAHMERARAKRAPFTDPRDGRLFRQIRFAFTVSGGNPLSTTDLLNIATSSSTSGASFAAGIAPTLPGLPAAWQPRSVARLPQADRSSGRRCRS